MTIHKLFDAIDNEDLSSVRRYLESGVDPNIIVDGFGTLTDALSYIESKDTIKISELLIAYGADPNMLTKYGRPLDIVSRGTNIKMLAMLLDAGANPNFRYYREGWEYPLYSACKTIIDNAKHRDATDLEMVELLLENGGRSTINEYSGYGGCTPLSIAAASIHLELIKMLLDFGADTSATDEDGYTAFESLPPQSKSNAALIKKAYELLDPKN